MSGRRSDMRQWPAEKHVGWAIQTVGADQAAMALAQPEPWGRLCRTQAQAARQPSRVEGWRTLGRCRPDTVRRRLAAAGLSHLARAA